MNLICVMKSEIHVTGVNMLPSVRDVTLRLDSVDSCEVRWINKSFIWFNLQ